MPQRDYLWSRWACPALTPTAAWAASPPAPTAPRNRRSISSAAPAGEPDSTENGRLYAIDSDRPNTSRRLTNIQGQVALQWLITGFGEMQPAQGATGYALNGINTGEV